MFWLKSNPDTQTSTMFSKPDTVGTLFINPQVGTHQGQNNNHMCPGAKTNIGFLIIYFM